MAKSVLASLFLLHSMIANRVSDAVAGLIAQISMRNLPALVTVTLAFALLREATAGENRQRTVESETLLRTSSSWDGEPYKSYPPGQPELSILKITLAPHTELEWHSHPIPNAAYIASGELTIERKKDGKKQHFTAGQAVSETVDTFHRGVAGDEPVVLIVFYAGSPGVPLTQHPCSKIDSRRRIKRRQLNRTLQLDTQLARTVNMWPDNHILDLFGIQSPIIQAPMAGSVFSEMVVAVSEAGGLGSLPCALLGVEQARSELGIIRRQTSRPINVNFFCHQPPQVDPAREVVWRKRLDAYFVELGLDNNTVIQSANRAPFDDKMCDLVTEFHPEVVSFHFGLPDKNLLSRVSRAGAKIISSATSVDEARWLEDQGCDAIVAQGYEAGGHRGVFLTQDVSTQVGMMALVPQVVDAVRVPVIAAGGIADARGIVAAFALGAAAAQIGTAYLLCPEAKTSAIYRQALRNAKDNETVVTNVFTGRPARGIVNRLIREVGPMSDVAPDFPLAAAALAPLRSKSEMAGSGDFTPLWSGQAARLSRELPAAELTKRLAAEALETIRSLRQKGAVSGASRFTQP